MSCRCLYSVLLSIVALSGLASASSAHHRSFGKGGKISARSERTPDFSSIGLFNRLPVEILEIIFSSLPKVDRTRLIRLSNGSREVFLNIGLLNVEKRYRAGLEHLFKLDNLIKQGGSEWQTFWFKSKELSEPERHELFFGSSPKRQAGLYLSLIHI